MFAQGRERFGSFDPVRHRWAALASAGAAVVALAPASPASAATTVVHSATSGELDGSRLLLHGVHGKVTWIHDSGDSGRVSVRRLHRRGFAPGHPVATGVLHVAGHRGGDEPTFRLSKPRYNRARRTVSYRAKPLNNKPVRGRVVRAAGAGRPTRFGAASLSIVPSPQLDGQHCHGKFGNGATFPLVAQGSAWDSDSWDSDPDDDVLYGRQGLASIATWESHGPWAQGCSNTVTWSWIDGSDPPATSPLVVSITTYVKWDGSDHSNTCSVTTGGDKYKCEDDGTSAGNSAYIVTHR
jgi:hypothetical protein